MAADYHFGQLPVRPEDRHAYGIAQERWVGFIGGRQTEYPLLAVNHIAAGAAGKDLTLPDDVEHVAAQHIFRLYIGVSAVGGIDIEHIALPVCNKNTVIQVLYNFKKIQIFSGIIL